MALNIFFLEGNFDRTETSADFSESFEFERIYDWLIAVITRCN